MTCPFRIVIWDVIMKSPGQYVSSPSIQKFCELLLSPTSSRLSLIVRLVMQTPSFPVLCNWNSSLVTSTSSRLKQCSNSLKPLGIVAIVFPLCFILMASPSYHWWQSGHPKARWHSDSSALDVTRMQNSEMSFYWMNVLIILQCKWWLKSRYATVVISQWFSL